MESSEEGGEEDPRRRFHILEELGKGSCGVVYKARCAKTQELVAVKIIPLAQSVCIDCTRES